MTIESVLVGAYPVVAVRTTHDTGNTCCSNGILSAQLVTHIAKTYGLAGVHVDTFLEQTQPYVAVLVHVDAIYFSCTEVYITAVVGVVDIIAIIRIIDAQPQAVVTYHDMTAIIGVEGRDVLSTCGIDMAWRVANQFKHTGMRRCNEDAALMVLTDVAYHTGFLF